MNDLISRQAAIDALVKAIREDPYYDSDGAGLGVCDVRLILNELPSAQPERMRGRWLKAYGDHEAFGIRPFYRFCSECNESTVWPYNYCPNCGARMMKGEEDEDRRKLHQS